MSASTTSMPRARAAWMASKITAAESPFSWLITVTLLRSPQTCSCSRAAARKVSPAASSTDRPCAWYSLASLPMVVVLPAPLTPASIRMKGLCGVTSSGACSGVSRSTSACFQRVLQVGRLGEPLAPHFLLQGVEQRLGGVDADVGGDEDGFEFLEQLGVDLAADAEQAGQLAAEPVAGLGESLLQPLRPARTRLGSGRFGGRRGRDGLRRRLFGRGGSGAGAGLDLKKLNTDRGSQHNCLTDAVSYHPENRSRPLAVCELQTQAIRGEHHAQAMGNRFGAAGRQRTGGFDGRHAGQWHAGDRAGRSPRAGDGVAGVVPRRLDGRVQRHHRRGARARAHDVQGHADACRRANSPNASPPPAGARTPSPAATTPRISSRCRRTGWNCRCSWRPTAWPISSSATSCSPRKSRW